MALSVLVADDSKIMRLMIAKSMNMAGIPIENLYEAENGQDAIDKLHEHPVDFVLVDINMPVMTGLEFIDNVRKDSRYEYLPIIVVSSEGSEARICALHEKGIGFVRKPFEPFQLRNEIINLTGVDTDDDYGTSAAAGGDADF